MKTTACAVVFAPGKGSYYEELNSLETARMRVVVSPDFTIANRFWHVLLIAPPGKNYKVHYSRSYGTFKDILS